MKKNVNKQIKSINIPRLIMPVIEKIEKQTSSPKLEIPVLERQTNSPKSNTPTTYNNSISPLFALFSQNK